MKTFLKLAMAVAMTSALVCSAQEQGPDAEQAPDQAQVQADASGQSSAQEGPGPGVARVSFIHGDVSTQRGDSGDWSAAALNQPVVAGDRISTADGGRAEVQLDFANLLRLGSNAQANVTDLTAKRIQVQVGQGTATYSVYASSEIEPEIDTPNVAVHPAHKDGSFRIEVRSDGDTIIIARKGEAELTTAQGSVEIHSGEMVTVRGTAEEAQYKTGDAPGSDDWDRWNSERDHKIEDAEAWRHTNNNHYYTGAEDLDTYGHWRNVADYGDVWVPSDAGFTPYRSGHWVYEPYYGWTWVSSEPWGWAPYHYGRWMYADDEWVWWPGPVWTPVIYRPIWAPAYVSFWGFGGGFGFGFGGGFGWGWLPIGPCDYFNPWWGYGRNRFNVVNVTNITNITNINNRNGFGSHPPLHVGTRYSNVRNLNNDHILRALTTTKGEEFGTNRMKGQPVTRTMFNNAHMLNGNLPVVPTKASLSASGRAAAPGSIRTGPSNFFGHAPTARPVSFDHQVSSLQQSIKQDGHFTPVQAGGRTPMNPIAQSRSLPGTSPQSGNFGKPSAGTGTNEPRVGNTVPAPTNTMGRSNPPSGGDRNGYRPFTPPSHNVGQAAPGQSENRTVNAAPQNRPFPTTGSTTVNRTPTSGGTTDRNGWKPFVPPSRGGNGGGSEAPRGISGTAPTHGGNPTRSGSGTYWERTAPPSSGSGSARSSGGSYGERNAPSPHSYGSSGSSGSGRGYGRPQLDMRQPIAQPRSSGGYGGGGYRPPPSYGGGHSGGYGGGGGYGGSAPRSAPSGGGYSGGSHGAPSGGGGHPSGGGGGGGSHGPSGGGGRQR